MRRSAHASGSISKQEQEQNNEDKKTEHKEQKEKQQEDEKTEHKEKQQEDEKTDQGTGNGENHSSASQKERSRSPLLYDDFPMVFTP